MVNRRSKGKRIEQLVRSILHDRGFLTDFKPSLGRRNTKYRYSEDLFGEFDVIAIRGSELRLIQVKSNMSHFYTARKAISQWCEDNNITLDYLEVWCWIGSDEFRIERLDHKSKKWIVST